MGKKASSLDDEFKTEDFKVKGCQSQVWLVPSFEDGQITFRADSDAAIVRGIVSLIYSCLFRLNADGNFKFLNQHLSMTSSFVNILVCHEQMGLIQCLKR